MSDQTSPRQLRRSSDQRLLGGVAAGLARHLRIDPVIVRIAFVVSVFFGGIGVVVYATAWLIVADDSGRSIVGVGRVGLGESDNVARVAGIVLVSFAAVLVIGQWSDASGVVSPLLLIAAGAWLLLRPHEPAHEPEGGATDVPHPPQGRPSTPDPAPEHTAPTPYTTVIAPPPPPPDPPPTPSGPAVGQITLAFMVLTAGGFGLAAAVWDGTRLDTALITCLAITGVGLLVGAFVGRSAPLIPLGLVLLAALSVTSALDLDVRGGIGDRLHTPRALSEVQDEYRLGIGEMVIDLRGLDADDLRGKRLVIDADIAIGSLEIVVPPDVELTGSADAQLGAATAFAEEDEGADASVAVVRDAPEGAGTIHIDAGVGLGEVQVR